jgi:DNA-binding winged helix-turn-helix (wHTH) protein
VNSCGKIASLRNAGHEGLVMVGGIPDRARFGPFLLDQGTREMRRGLEPIHLTPKAFDLLTLLIEHRPRAVPKAVLHDRLWPKTFVADANLAILIGEVRAALDDTARRPTYIRTIHGYGYAFCAELIDESIHGAHVQGSASGATCWLISKTQHVALREGENCVGRDPSVNVWLDAKSVSRRHACIVVDCADATIRDLGSKNGTWVQGQRLTSETSLSDGDQIRFGSIRMTFRVWSGGGSTETTQSADP